MFGYLIDNGDDIDPHLAFADAASATGTLMHPKVIVEVLKLVVHPLAQPGTGILARIVTGRVRSETRELAVVPGAHPLALQLCLALNLAVDIEATAGQVQEGANATAEKVDIYLTGIGAILENRVILLILELVDAIAKAIVAQAERRTERNNLDEREALAQQRFLDRLDDVARMHQRPACDVGGTGGIHQERKAERIFVVAVRRSRCNGRAWRGRRHLTSGHAISEVVVAYNHQVHIPPCRMDQVIAADSGQVALTAEHHHRQFRVGQLDAGSHGNGATMRGVDRIKVDVTRDTSGATDTRYHNQLLGVDAAALDRLGKRVHLGADAAAGTPDMRHAIHAQGVGHRAAGLEFFDIGTHLLAFLMASRMTWGSCTAPPQ